MLVVLALAVAACSGSDEAQTCDDIGDQTVAQMQRLIDSVDEEFGALTIDEFLGAEVRPSNLDELAEISEDIERRTDELGCSGDEVRARVTAQLSNLTAETDVGRVFLDLLVSGGA